MGHERTYAPQQTTLNPINKLGRGRFPYILGRDRLPLKRLEG
jgi:hypothetical protein